MGGYKDWVWTDLYFCCFDVKVELVCWPYYYLVFFLLHLVAMFSTCCNPVLYGWLSSPPACSSSSAQCGPAAPTPILLTQTVVVRSVLASWKCFSYKMS